MASKWNVFWKGCSSCWKKDKLTFVGDADGYEFEDDLEEAKELKKSEKNKKGLRRRKKKKDKGYYRREEEEDIHSSAEEFFDSPPQYPPWVWQAMGMEDPLSVYAASPGAEQQGFYVDPGSMGKIGKQTLERSYEFDPGSSGAQTLALQSFEQGSQRPVLVNCVLSSTEAYSRTYGYFSGFGMNCISNASDAYFTPNIAAATVPDSPSPSVAKVLWAL